MTRPADKVITLQSKLTPPRLKNTIPRKRLLPLFEDIEHHKAVIVTAGAGYGKTICAAQACSAMDVATVWYGLDPTDGDLAVFLNYLVAGIRKYYPDFGRQTLAGLRTVEQFQSEQQERRTLFLHELETTVQRQMVIVLDDFHLIHENPEIAATCDFLLQHLPEPLHLIIISRTPPCLDLSRVIAARQVYDISENDLMFNREETASLYRDIFGIALSDDTLKALSQKTGGWAVGLILFHYALKNKDELCGDARTQLSLLNGNYRVFSDYLRENLFKILPENISSFLLQTAILPVLDVGFCNRLLKIDNAGEILDHLEKMHLFTSAVDAAGQTYQYHHLFRDYLRVRLEKEYDAAAVSDLHVAAARIRESENDAQQAIEHYLAAGVYDRAAVLMVTHGEEMIETGMVNQIMTHCEQLPRRFLESEPWLKLLMGSVFYSKGRTRESLEVIESARRQFRQKGDQDGEGRCITLMGILYCVLNRFSKAEDTFKALLNRKGITPDIYALCLSNLIFISTRLDKPEQVQRYFKKAAPLLDRTDQPLWSVWIRLFYGFSRLSEEQFNEAIHCGEQAEKLARRLNKFNLAAMCCHLISAALCEMGEFEQGYQKAREGIRLCEKLGFQGSTYAWCLISAGFSATGLGRQQETLALGRKALEISEAADSGWTSAHAHIVISVAHGRMADFDNGETECRKALTAIQGTGLILDEAIIQAFLAWMLLGRQRVDEALSFIRSAEKRSSFKIKRWVLLFYCAVDAIQGDIESAKNRLVSVLEFMLPGGKDRLLMEHQSWIVPFLVAIYAEGQCRPQIETLLPRFSPEHVETIKQFHYHESEEVRTAARTLTSLLNPGKSEDLKVLCFGRFRLYKGDTEIKAQQWTSVKARMLFKYLALHSRHGYVARDRLLEMLWPDQDPEVTSKRLHVALTAIRKMLEPELPRGTASAYLLRDNEGYRLHPGDNGYLDLTAFDDAINAARQNVENPAAIETLLQAMSLYKGDLFEEEPYLEWCAAEREQYREKYAWLLRQIADHYESARMYDKSIAFLNRLLPLDEYDEQVYRRLMTLYYKSGHRNKAVKIYEQCKRKLESDLDCPLSEQTEQLFTEILTE